MMNRKNSFTFFELFVFALCFSTTISAQQMAMHQTSSDETLEEILGVNHPLLQKEAAIEQSRASIGETAYHEKMVAWGFATGLYCRMVVSTRDFGCVWAADRKAALKALSQILDEETLKQMVANDAEAGLLAKRYCVTP